MDWATASIPVNSPFGEALPRVRRSLESVGMRLLETFNLQMARSSGTGCTCPRHGTAGCDCQMVVLMVYGEATAPAAVLLHGCDGQTWISIPDAPVRGLDPLIEAAIDHAIRQIDTAEGL